MRNLPHRVLACIRRHKLLKAGDRVGVAVSGGADSVAMLRLLLELRQELGVVLSVVHFNHQLRGADSDADERFVAELAARHKLPLHRESGDVAARAASSGGSVEAAAREMRYAFFDRLLQENCMDRVATGHTLDDQAETVLLRLVRGAGTKGLAGIYPSRQSSVVSLQEKTIIRPLLEIRRTELESYLRPIGQDWREDRSNRDLRFARNRVRHGILPRLEKSLNPAVRETLAETAEIARAEEEFWQREIERILPQVWDAQEKKLAIRPLAAVPLALQRRLVRAAAESLKLKLEFRQVQELLDLAGQLGKSANLPDGWIALVRKQDLCFVPGSDSKSPPAYEYNLPVPGRVAVPEAGVWFEAALVSTEAVAGYNRDNLLDPELLAKSLQVRSWRPGERFWPAHTKAPKKIKELLQERQVSGPGRQTWPVVVSGDQIVWVRGFAAPLKLQPGAAGKPALAIREIQLSESVEEARAASYGRNPKS